MLKRVQELKKLRILDTEEEEIFNDIVATASNICEAPISLITLLDVERQWFKAKVGTKIKETPIEFSVCRHTIDEPNGIMLIEDLSNDRRFADNPMVISGPKLKSYLGISLKTPSGESIGTVCVLDNKVRSFDEKQIQCLETLAKYTMKLIDEKILRYQLEQQNQLLTNLNKNLESFTYMVAHDVKAPIRVMSTFTKFILEDRSNQLSESSEEYISYIKEASADLGVMVDRLLEYSKKILIKSDQFELINLTEILEEKISLLDYKKSNLEYDISAEFPPIFFSKPILEQTIQNLISNAIEYSDDTKAVKKLKVSATVIDKFTVLSFEDNGIGMTQEILNQVFIPFQKDIRIKNSSGIGLCVVKVLLDKVGGKIELESDINQGTTVTVYIPK